MFSVSVLYFLRMCFRFCESILLSASVFDMCILFDLYGPPYII